MIRDGQQVTEFQEGIVPWALQRPVALIFDEYDAGRPDVMFVIQRILERDGKFTLLDQNRVIRPNPYFRLFATANTVGLGNLNGLYQGAQVLNHAQIDRWNIVATLNYLSHDAETAIVLAKAPMQVAGGHVQGVGDALLGLFLSLTGIFLTLAWVFSSWTRPLAAA